MRRNWNALVRKTLISKMKIWRFRFKIWMKKSLQVRDPRQFLCKSTSLWWIRLWGVCNQKMNISIQLWLVGSNRKLWHQQESFIPSIIDWKESWNFRCHRLNVKIYSISATTTTLVLMKSTQNSKTRLVTSFWWKEIWLCRTDTKRLRCQEANLTLLSHTSTTLFLAWDLLWISMIPYKV